MRHATVLALVFLVACSRAEPPMIKDAGVKPLARAAFANFNKGQLIECVDISTTGAIDEIGSRLADMQSISQPCAKAFADRITLALCTVEQRTDAGASATLTIAHYDFEAVGLSDQTMSDCLAEGGKWNPLSRESPLFQRARLEYSERKLNESANKLNGLGKP